MRHMSPLSQLLMLNVDVRLSLDASRMMFDDTLFESMATALTAIALLEGQPADGKSVLTDGLKTQAILADHSL